MSKQLEVLVVDDNQDLCQMIETILVFEGYNVARCCEASQVAEALAKHRPKVLVMDMLLSGKDGSDICYELKEAGSELKILMVSAHPDAEEICLNAGADDFLAKPFDIDQLTEKVKKLYESVEKVTS